MDIWRRITLTSRWARVTGLLVMALLVRDALAAVQACPWEMNASVAMDCCETDAAPDAGCPLQTACTVSPILTASCRCDAAPDACRHQPVRRMDFSSVILALPEPIPISPA
jgi:hypothetical protein